MVPSSSQYNDDYKTQKKEIRITWTGRLGRPQGVVLTPTWVLASLAIKFASYFGRGDGEWTPLPC